MLQISVCSILYPDEVELQQPYMKEFASLNDEHDDLIDPFVKKLVAVGSSRTEDKKDESESRSSPPVEEDATPKQPMGNHIKN